MCYVIKVDHNIPVVKPHKYRSGCIKHFCLKTIKLTWTRRLVLVLWWDKTKFARKIHIEVTMNKIWGEQTSIIYVWFIRFPHISIQRLFGAFWCWWGIPLDNGERGTLHITKYDEVRVPCFFPESYKLHIHVFRVGTREGEVEGRVSRAKVSPIHPAHWG